MRKRSSKVRNRKRQHNHPKIQWAWPVGVALAGITVVLSCLVMQMHKHLETVQGELHNLEQTTAGLRRNLQNSDFERSRLEGKLKEANSTVEQLRKAVDASNVRDEKWQTRLESMQSQLEHVRESAEMARAAVAESEKQVAALRAMLDETNSKRHALQAELKTAYSEAEQLKSELDSKRSRVFEMESSEGKPKDARDKPEPGTIGKRTTEAGAGSARLRKGSLDAVSPPAERHHALLEPGSGGRDYLIRTLVFEASGETEIGKAAVAHVILNRKRSGRWGHKIEEVVTSPWQFEPWMTRKGEIEGLSRTDPRYLKAAEIADAVLTGHIPDPTAGATHFLNPVIVRKRRGGSLPSWADSDGRPIGRHVFYCPECDGSKPTQAAAVESLGSAGMRREG